MSNRYNVPSYAAIVESAKSLSLFSGDSPLFVVKKCSASIAPEDRTAYVRGTAVAVRRDGAMAKSTKHQLPTTGFTVDIMASMPNVKAFANTGEFFCSPVDAITEQAYYKSGNAIGNAIVREIGRKCAENDAAVFNGDIFWRRRNTSAAYNAECDDAAKYGGIAASPRSNNFRDLHFHCLANLAVCSLIILPLNGMRSMASEYRVSPVWRDALVAAVAAYDAAQAAKLAENVASVAAESGHLLPPHAEGDAEITLTA